MAISEKNAALLIKEQELDQQFEKRFTELYQSEEKQQLLSKNIKDLGRPNATKDILIEIEKLLG